MMENTNLTIAIRKSSICRQTAPPANVVCHDLDLHFHGYEFWNVNISRALRDSENAQLLLLKNMIFSIEWDYCDLLYSMTLTQIFKVKLFKLLFWEVNAGKMQTLLLPSYRKSGICHRTARPWMLFVMIFTYIFTVTHFEMWISRKRWEEAKNVQTLLL